jgi:hypothetical protein
VEDLGGAIAMMTEFLEVRVLAAETVVPSLIVLLTADKRFRQILGERGHILSGLPQLRITGFVEAEAHYADSHDH